MRYQRSCLGFPVIYVSKYQPRHSGNDRECMCGASTAVSARSRRAKMIRWSILVAACAALLFCLGNCTAPSDPWVECCQLLIVNDQDQGTPQRRTIIDWQGGTQFSGSGGQGEPGDEDHAPFHEVKRQRMAAGLVAFIERHPRSSAREYFLSLGMTCASSDRDTQVTHCEIEVPIAFRCASYWSIDLPVPKQLRGTFPALLRVDIDTSATKFPVLPGKLFSVSVDATTPVFISTNSQVVPPPGGHLCTR